MFAEFFSVLLLAVALGMDAFSVCIGMGMRYIKFKRIVIIGLVIGIFHLVMPYIGMIMGRTISAEIGSFAIIAGGLLLTGIGAHMFFEAFRKKPEPSVAPIGLGLYLIAFLVSIDSFSVGLSLGLSYKNIFLALFLFAFVSMVFSWLGLLIGRKVSGLLGSYSELLGGSILFSFGIKMLFI